MKATDRPVEGSEPPDSVIRGGLVVDGRGNEPYRADIVLSGGRIAAIAPDSAAAGAVAVDAGGLVIAPGLIDVHTHADLLAFLPDDVADLRRAPLMQGVTTLVVGNCGFSVFPGSSVGSTAVATHLATLFGPGAPTFDDFAGYAAAVEESGIDSNIAALVGQGTLRAAVVGFERRRAGEGEIDEMRRLAATAIEQGALGLSSGLLYPPGSFADTDEVAALAEAAGRAGALYVTHVRNEMDLVDAALEEAIEVARRTGAALQISHLKSAGKRNHGRLPDLLETLSRASDDGLDIAADAYPYERGSTVLHALLPPWATEGGVEAMVTRLGSVETRMRLRRDFASSSPGWQNFIDGGSWDDVTIASAPSSPGLEGSTVTAASMARSQDPVDFVADLIVSTAGSVTITVEMAAESDVTACLGDPMVMVGSDGIPVPGKPHPRWAGAFSRTLSRAGRQRFGLSLPEAVRKMSAYPARRFGLSARGVIEPGAFADLVAFDDTRLEDRATYAEPLLAPAGVQHVWVNGHHVVDAGHPTGARHGRMLTRAPA